MLNKLLPVLAVATAFTIDYSKQPPRELQLQAGASLAIAGFIVTFLVLGVLTLIIKVIAVIGERVEAKKAVPAAPATPAAMPAIPVQPTVPADTNVIAAAVAAVHAYLKEKARAGPKPVVLDAWVLGERVFPPGSQFADELSLRESARWRKR